MLCKLSSFECHAQYQSQYDNFPAYMSLPACSVARASSSSLSSGMLRSSGRSALVHLQGGGGEVGGQRERCAAGEGGRVQRERRRVTPHANHPWRWASAPRRRT